jgi:hypothetical protein
VKKIFNHRCTTTSLERQVDLVLRQLAFGAAHLYTWQHACMRDHTTAARTSCILASCSPTESFLTTAGAAAADDVLLCVRDASSHTPRTVARHHVRR